MNNKNTWLVIIALTAVIGLSMIACDLNDDDNGNGSYKVGDTGPGGGIIFYHDPAGFTMTDTGLKAYYLEAAPVNQSTSAQWGSRGAEISGVTNLPLGYFTPDHLKTMIGKGRNDTALIVAHMAENTITGTAAQLCANYTGGGKTDWFLPNIGELVQLWNNRAITNMSNDTYWSSTQYDAASAEVILFGSGGAEDAKFKDAQHYVRAIRAF